MLMHSTEQELQLYLDRSTVQPAWYNPQRPRQDDFAVVAEGGKSLIVTGFADSPAAVAMAQALAAEPQTRRMINSSGVSYDGGSVQFKIVPGNIIPWKPAMQAVMRKDTGDLLVMIINEPSQILQHMLCVQPTLVKILHPETTYDYDT